MLPKVLNRIWLLLVGCLEIEHSDLVEHLTEVCIKFQTLCLVLKSAELLLHESTINLVVYFSGKSENEEDTVLLDANKGNVGCRCHNILINFTAWVRENRCNLHQNSPFKQ